MERKAKLNHNAPSVSPNIADLLAEPYVCNSEPANEGRIKPSLKNLRTKKLSEKMVYEPFKCYPSSFITHLQ